MITRILSGISTYCPEYGNSTLDIAVTDDGTAEIRSVAYQILAPITISIGIFGNLLNLLVLTVRPFLKGGTRVYLTALAISDLSVMITVIPMVVRWNHSQWTTLSAAFYHAHIELFLNNTFIASSVFIVVCLTIERYFSVCVPTKFRNAQTVPIARWAIVVCFFMGVVVSAPLTVLKNVCLVKNDSYQCPRWDFHENKKITNTIYWSSYLWFTEFLMRLGPCIILAVLNILIIRKFSKITGKRKILQEALLKTRNKQYPNDAKLKKALRNRRYHDEKRLITLLRSIVILFFVTMTPSAILSLIYAEEQEWVIGIQVFRALANNLELANFALNFYVYFFCSKEFRNALKQILTGCFVCEEETTDVESGDLDSNRISNMLKIINFKDSNGEQASLELSTRSFSTGND